MKFFDNIEMSEVHRKRGRPPRLDKPSRKEYQNQKYKEVGFDCDICNKHFNGYQRTAHERSKTHQTNQKIKNYI